MNEEALPGKGTETVELVPPPTYLQSSALRIFLGQGDVSLRHEVASKVTASASVRPRAKARCVASPFDVMREIYETLEFRSRRQIIERRQHVHAHHV